MIGELISFLIMLNPFALFLYLHPIMKKLDDQKFVIVLYKATMISFLIYILFLIIGDYIFQYIFRIHFESFRIFGGVVIFSFAYLFIVKGRKAMIFMKSDLNDLASEIALPFMVGAGTISLTLLMSHNHSFMMGFMMLAFVLSCNFFIIIGLKKLRANISKKKLRLAFDKNLEIFLRLNGFFLGAIGVNMIIIGIQNFFF